MGRIAARATLERIKENEEIREIFDVEKAPARGQPAYVFRFLPFLYF